MCREIKKREGLENKPSSPTSESMPKLLAGGKADNVQMELDSSVRGLDAPHIKMERRGDSAAATWAAGKPQITQIANASMQSQTRSLIQREEDFFFS